MNGDLAPGKWCVYHYECTLNYDDCSVCKYRFKGHVPKAGQSKRIVNQLIATDSVLTSS